MVIRSEEYIKEYHRRKSMEWRRANPERRAEQLRSWKGRNPEKVREQRRRHRERHPDAGKIYYEANRDKLRADAAKRRREKRDFLANYKRECGCQVCGENEPCCLDFHHLNNEDKDYTMGALRMYSEKTMLGEIQKCAVLCSNCHRKLHMGLIKLDN